MNEQNDSPRSRFANVIHRSAVPSEKWGDESGKFAVQSREIAVALNAKELGYCIVTLEPGKRSCPYHFHHAEEELFFVLEGSGTLRQGDENGEEEIVLVAGDFAAFPPDTGIAHQFYNHTEAAFVYLAFSNRSKLDVAEYPDSDKLLVRGPRRRMLPRNPTLQYFDGE